MPNRGKIAIILLSVVIIASLSLAGVVFYSLQQERKHSTILKDELDDVKAKQQITESELQKYKSSVASLEVKLREASDSVDKLTSDLQAEQDARQQALTEIEQLKADLVQNKSLRSDLEKKFSQAQSEAQKLQAQLKDLSDKKAELEDKLKKYESAKGVELGTIVVNNENTPAQGAAVTAAQQPESKGTAAALEGKVLVLNKEYNFVVLNLGTKDGVKIGDVFSVYHTNKIVGEVKVEKVHDSMSAAGFSTADVKEKVSEGDKVIQKTK